MTTNLGSTTSIEVINQRLALDGQDVVDVGCGDMTFSRLLADAGARVLAIDPDAVQAALNRAAEPTRNLDFIEAGAEVLPAADSSVDGVFFSFSLHHVPVPSYPKVFAEVVRILKPSGSLCVIEPADCPLNEVMKLFHNEDRERAAAQRALIQWAVPAFETHDVFRYHSVIQYKSFEAFVEQHGSRTFNSGFAAADVRRDEVREAFEQRGAPNYRFMSPKEMMVLQGLKTRKRKLR